MTVFEKLIVLWNAFHVRNDQTDSHGLDLGGLVVDGNHSELRVRIPHVRRTHHIALLGKTGTGKSTLLRRLAEQDVKAGRGFCFFDLHGDATPILLRLIARQEGVCSADLSGKTIVIEPADPDFSVGLNPLENLDPRRSFIQIAEFAQILKQRWQLTAFGARTEELLRNSLFVLSENGFTLLELAPLLTNYAFRASCLRTTGNLEIKRYFQNRYDKASDAMQGVLRDPILNKTSVFASDPHFRHILGQKESSFSLVDALDEGFWILLNLEKGRLGEQAATLGSLFLTKLKNALFSRRRRDLFTFYCDEIQNLVAFDSGLDTLLSEARKFGVSVCSANQFLEQYPPQMRAAILAVGTHVFFQLSAQDADKIAALLGEGKSLAHVLKNLPQRRMVVKSAHHRFRQAKVPWVEAPREDASDLYERCRRRWAALRAEIERDIQDRYQESERSPDEVLHDWT